MFQLKGRLVFVSEICNFNVAYRHSDSGLNITFVDLTRFSVAAFCGVSVFYRTSQILIRLDAIIVDSVSDTLTILALEIIYIKRRKPSFKTKEEFGSH